MCLICKSCPAGHPGRRDKRIYRLKSASYGLENHAICDYHFEKLKDHMARAFANLDRSYLVDFVMLKVLMLDKETVCRQLKFFNDNMQNIDNIPITATKGPRLRVVLSTYEQKCYFADFLIAPLEFIKTGFDNLGRSGFLSMNDFGAGIGHGKYTHRMQWHVVMRVLTDHFRTHVRAPWTKSPLDLYITAMSTQGDIDRGADLNHHSTNLFGYIFDQSADGGGSFSWPDELFTEMRNQAKYPVLARSTSKIWMKRQTEKIAYDSAKAAYEKQYYAHYNAGVKLQAAQAEMERHSWGPRRWLASLEVDAARAALQALPAPGPKPLTPAQAYKQKLLGKGYQSMGSIPDADPYGTRAASAPDIDYADTVLVPTGALPPTTQDLQNNLVLSRSQLNPHVNLVTSAVHGHA
jgi:hypothetical protein